MELIVYQELPVEDTVEGQVILSVLRVANGNDLLKTLEQQTNHLHTPERVLQRLAAPLTSRERAMGPR